MMKKETLKLSNSINLSERPYDICKCGWMTKRSQNKKRFTPVNYKLRWFELTKYYLTYFDVEGVEVSFFYDFDFDFIFFVICHPIAIFNWVHFILHIKIIFFVSTCQRVTATNQTASGRAPQTKCDICFCCCWAKQPTGCSKYKMKTYSEMHFAHKRFDYLWPSRVSHTYTHITPAAPNKVVHKRWLHTTPATSLGHSIVSVCVSQ